MKLNSIPSVRVENLSTRLSAFFGNNNLPAISLGPRRAKKLESWYAERARWEADVRSRGFTYCNIDPLSHMVELKWERYCDPVWQTTNMRVAVSELGELRLDATTVSAARQSAWVRLLAYNHGDICSFRWVLK
jgi:hypothetical protein